MSSADTCASSAATSRPWPSPRMMSNNVNTSARVVVSFTDTENSPAWFVAKLVSAAIARATISSLLSATTVIVSNQVSCLRLTPFALRPVAKMLAKRLMRCAIVLRPCGPW